MLIMYIPPQSTPPHTPFIITRNMSHVQMRWVFNVHKIHPSCTPGWNVQFVHLSNCFKYRFILILNRWTEGMTMTMTMTKFILKIKTSFEVYKRYIYVQNK